MPGKGRASAAAGFRRRTRPPRAAAVYANRFAYEVMLTNAGGGYSSYNDPVSGHTVAVTRWRPTSPWTIRGTFIYLQDA